MPKWQFEPEIWFQVEAICECLGTADGWEILSFLESPVECLGGVSPRTALERGVPVERVLAAAVASAH